MLAFVLSQAGILRAMVVGDRPLNASTTSSTFNSLFVDVDCHFGSAGSFFATFPTSGCFEVGEPPCVLLGLRDRYRMRVFDPLCLTAQANPPFDRESVASMYRHINTVLARADADSAGSGPIMYVVVAPRSCSVEGKAATVDKVRQNKRPCRTVEPIMMLSSR